MFESNLLLSDKNVLMMTKREIVADYLLMKFTSEEIDSIADALTNKSCILFGDNIINDNTCHTISIAINGFSASEIIPHRPNSPYIQES